MPDEEYRAAPGLSQSALKALLDCPARFKHEQSNPRPSSPEAEFGTLVHSLLLDEHPRIEVVDAPDWRTKTAQESRRAIRADGGIPVLASGMDRAEACARSVMGHPLAGSLLAAEGGTEESLFWTHGSGLAMKGRVDKVAAGPRTTLVDVKTARSADPRQFANSVLSWGYHIQQAVYLDGWRAATGDDAAFVFVVVETEPPYLTAVYSLDEALSAHGVERYGAAVALYAECEASGEWPGYGSATEAVEIAAPGWLRQRLVEDVI
jgi:hypothetical protein